MRLWKLLVALLSVSSACASANSSVEVAHFEPLQKLTLERPVAAAQQKPNGASPLKMGFDALGQSFNVDLEPNDSVLSPSARRSLPAGIALYRGRVTGRSGSWARIVIANGEPRGLIWNGDDMYVIEAAGDSAVQSQATVAYRLADTYVPPGTMNCGSAVGSSGAAMYTQLVGELSAAQAAAPGAASEIHLSAIGDFEYFDRVGGNAETAILTRLNNVDGIYSEQLGVQITVETLEVHAVAEDPFSDTSDSGTLLDELGRYRRDTPLHRAHGLTHLYTGRNLDDTTVGIAYLEALCSPRFGAGLTEGRHGATFESLITAHEIGHNFGAPHDGEEGSACEAESENFLMASSVNGSRQFSQCSIAQIQPHIAAASCITSLPVVDMTISAATVESPLKLGDDVSVTFDVSNLGATEATGVLVEVTLPEAVEFVSIEASAGACSSGAGSLSCELGAIPGGSSRTVTVIATAIATGEAPFRALVLADADDNAANDSAVARLSIVEAVDLSVNTLPATRVGLNQSATIRVGMDNRSSLGATGVKLAISLGQGLRADDATWSLGSCTVEPQQIDCQSDDFVARGSATADFVVTGTATGSQSYTVAVSSAQEDADTTDNTRDGIVTVNAVATDLDGGGGGGGAIGLFLLWLTGVAVFRARGERRKICWKAPVAILTRATPLGLIPRSLHSPAVEPWISRL